MPRGLFSRLLRLYPSPIPEEDYFTEMVAWLFENDRQLLYKWLKECLQMDAPYSACRVETQVEFDKLEGHTLSSRPDFLFTLYEDDQQDILMMESKISATEGYQQLPRYADQLSHGYPEARHRYLVYISRSYDPKETGYVLRNIGKQNIIFKQTRWFEFYKFLKLQPSDPLLDQVIVFMEEKRMAKISKITPAVLAALNVYPDVYNFFQTVLDDEVVNQFTQVVGHRPRNEEKRLWNLAEMRRYLLISDVGDHLIFYIGFKMPDSGDEFPSINAWFQIRPTAPDWKRHAQICKKIIADSLNNPLKWAGYNLDHPETDAGITLETSFEEMLCEPDHVLALKSRFLDYLDEYSRLQKEYPGLTE